MPLGADQGSELVLEPSAGPVLVVGDGKRIRQILLNLLSNALKFTPAQGQVRIRVSGDARGGVRFEIADSGIGLPPGDVAVALAPFGLAEKSELDR